MSPIFRHGRLRLYLLKLLDEAPRHGYEVIRLLQDRFMGVYSPSPGTIYPRLARLEEDGLVTHDEVDGRKVYRITDKGREEIHARLDDLAELEEELTESVRDIAREVTEDVRDTVRSLREEITWAARDFRREGDPGRRRQSRPADEAEPGDEDRADAEFAADQRDSAADQRDGDPSGAGRDGQRDRTRSDDAARIREEARRARDEIRDTFRAQRRGGAAGGPGQAGRGQSRPGGSGRTGAGQAGGAGAGRGADRSGADRTGADRSGADRDSGFGDDWGSWADRAASWQAWSDRGERRNPFGGGRPGAGRPGAGRPGGGRPGWGGWQDLAGGMPGGLERLASDFARELRSAAGHADDIREGALGDLRDILADTLARIRDEVFSAEPSSDTPPAEDAPAAQSAAARGAAEAGLVDRKDDTSRTVHGADDAPADGAPESPEGSAPEGSASEDRGKPRAE